MAGVEDFKLQAGHVNYGGARRRGPRAAQHPARPAARDDARRDRLAEIVAVDRDHRPAPPLESRTLARPPGRRVRWLVPRYFDALSSIGASLRAGLGYGLRSKLREGYTRADFRADAMAGLVVGVVALPLSMALAIASGVRPENGLYTALVAGVVCALLGGTRCQVTGPTAAFVVILLPVVTRFGVSGLLVAGMMAGVILVAMAAMRLGKLIQFIPHPVTTGFSAG